RTSTRVSTDTGSDYFRRIRAERGPPARWGDPPRRDRHGHGAKSRPVHRSTAEGSSTTHDHCWDRTTVPIDRRLKRTGSSNCSGASDRTVIGLLSAPHTSLNI